MIKVISDDIACRHETYAYAYCPSGTTLVGGGFGLHGENFRGNNADGSIRGTNSPDSSGPNWNGTAWQVIAGGYPSYCFKAYALCIE